MEIADLFWVFYHAVLTILSASHLITNTNVKGAVHLTVNRYNVEEENTLNR